MANAFSSDILIQAPDPKSAAAFYVDSLGFEVTGEEENMVSLHGQHINIFIEQGPLLGPVLEVTVDSVEAAKRRLLAKGCIVIKDEPDFPRCYVRDNYGLIYNLISHSRD
ncbi:MAG TPA: VOC family protein [Terracidiphilus sp.]|nr:VOC family protein [Terracidiphilus sp.]